MKGLILSGGAGTRLRPITHTSAKQLVPVANKPILFYGIEDMVEAGITEIGIVTGETGEEIVAAVGDGSDFGAKVTYLPQSAPLGLAHCVLIARDFLGDDDFVMYLGDNMLEQGLVEFIDRFELARRGDDPPAAQILLSPVPDPQRFGVAELDHQGRVVRLVEKPENPPSNLALVGVYLFTHAIHDAVGSIEPSARGELEITDAIQWLIDQGVTVHHDVLAGWWLDTGKKDPLLESNRRVLETLEPKVEGSVDAESVLDGRVVVEAGAEIVRSHVRGPAIIGTGTSITDSYIGPYSAIASECRIEHTELENSVVLERSVICDVSRLVDSLVGRDAVLQRTGQRPKATRLMVGDHCSIDLE